MIWSALALICIAAWIYAGINGQGKDWSLFFIVMLMGLGMADVVSAEGLDSPSLFVSLTSVVRAGLF